VILRLDAQLSPHLASWLSEHFELEAFSAKWLGLRDAKDHEIFAKAREEKAIVMTKDRDFVALVKQEGPPPQVLWITTGNTSTAHLKDVFDKTLKGALDLLEQGEALVEISDAVRT